MLWIYCTRNYKKRRNYNKVGIRVFEASRVSDAAFDGYVYVKGYII